MKLNPPASSSDIELARQTARRLHQTRRRDDRASWPSEEPVRPRLNPPPLPPRPAPVAEPEPEDLPRPRVESRPEPEAAYAPPPRPITPPPVVAPAPPARAPEPEIDVDVDDEPEFERPAPAPEPEEPAWSRPEPVLGDAEAESFEDLASEAPAFEPAPAFESTPELPTVDTDDDPIDDEALVGAPEADVSPLEGLTEPESGSSPFDDSLLDAAPVAEEPAPPSWDDVVETCRGMASAHGAMLVDPAGQVFSARGDWPPPGPEAIAGKLVAMMEKTLKDAPTRSISAPLMGMHLTAWRVSLPEGLVTIVFIGAAPVRADARPAIDREIASGAGV